MKNSKNKLVDLIVAKETNPAYLPEIGYCGNVFMIFGLPVRRLPENERLRWLKQIEGYDLIITNPGLMNHKTKKPYTEVPYGCYARLNQIFIDTEIKTKATNIIDVGKTFNEYVKKLGCKEGKANKEISRQLINYVTSIITFVRTGEENTLKGLQASISEKWDISFDIKSPDQIMLSKGQIIANPAYAQWIYDHCVPLNMDVVNVFKRNPLALDFYQFLAYRNNSLSKTLSFPDRLLFEQIETGIASEKELRRRLNNILKAIKLYWPVEAKFEDGYFELKPSVPAIAQTTASKRILEIKGDFTA